MSNTVREAAIEVAGLTKSYKSGDRVVEAVRGIDLRVEAGELYGFGAYGYGHAEGETAEQRSAARMAGMIEPVLSARGSERSRR